MILPKNLGFIHVFSTVNMTVNIGKLVLFEFMFVQRLDTWRQIIRSIIFLLKDLVMKPDIKSLDIFNEKVGFTIFDLQEY